MVRPKNRRKKMICHDRNGLDSEDELPPSFVKIKEREETLCKE